MVHLNGNMFSESLLGKFLDHVLIEMGYGLKPKGQNSKKQSTDSSEYGY